MDMGDYNRREPNPKKIKLEKNEGVESDESEDSWKCQPPVQTISQNNIKLEQEPDSVSGYERRPSNESNLMKSLLSKNLNSNGAHIHEQKLTGFNCHKCILHFATSGEMTRHWTERHGLRPAHCPVCTHPFPTNDDMWDHKMAIHGIPCEFCDGRFKTQEMLVAHMISVHSNDTSSANKQVFKEDSEINNSGNEEMMSPMAYSLHRAFPEVQNTISSGFKCHKCPQHYQTPDLLKCHWSDRHGLRPADCSVCKEIFPTVSEMSVHKMAIHGIPCQLCHGLFKTQEMLVAHVKSVHSNESFNESNLYQVSSLGHLVNSDGKIATRRNCNSCCFIALSEEELEVHMATHKFPFICSVCGMRFTSNTSYKQHKRDTLHERKFEASNIGFIPPGSRNWRPQTDREDISCERGMSFASPSIRKSAKGPELASSTSHSEGSTTIPISDTYNASLATFKCHLCPVVFGAGGALRDHWSNTHQFSPAHCTFCKKPFPSIPLMHAHKLELHGISCGICNKTFLKIASLEDHMKGVHGATKKCLICGMRFIRVIDLKEHAVSFHPDFERTIKKCEICPFMCTNDDEMVKHKGKHLSSSCPICGIVVSSKSALRRHIKETDHTTFTKSS